MLYLDHVYLLQCVKVVLPRDPSGRALIRGSVAGTGSVIALLILWVWALNGAIAQEDLINEAGTVITPLTQLLGPFVRVLGSIFIISFVGVAILKATNVLFNLVHERLPTQLRSKVLLPRRRGNLMLRRRGVLRDDLGLRLTYVGLTSGQPQLRLDVHINNSTQYVDFTVREHWDIAAVLDRVPALQPLRIGLTVDVLEAQPEQVRLRIASSLSLTYEGEWDTVGLRLVDALVLPDEYRHLINWMMRQTRVTLASVMDYTGQEENRARNLMAELVDQGFIQVIHDDGTPHYGVRMAPRRGRQLSQSIWQSLSTLDASTGPLSQTDSPAQSIGTPAVAQRVKALLLSERGRFWIGMSPVVLNFLLAEWLLLSSAASFARALSFAGVIGNSLTAGIFPILLLLASRRKGDFVPGVIYRLLDHPVLVSIIYLIFLVNLFLHGLIIWDHPLARICALLIGLASVGLTIAMVRRGAFARRLVVELRDDQRQDGQAVFNVLAGGAPIAANVELSYPDQEQQMQSASASVPSFLTLRHATFHLPPSAARELKVWAHTITPEGTSESLPALVEVHNGDTVQRFDMQLSGGQVVVPSMGATCWVRISRAEPASA